MESRADSNRARLAAQPGGASLEAVQAALSEAKGRLAAIENLLCEVE